MKGIKEIFMKNKERRKGWIASALAMVLLMGSIPFTSAFGVEETSDNETKTILTYAESESGTVLGEYIPNEDAEKAWQSGFSDFQSNMERDGYTNISEAFEENEMVYVGGEDSVVPAGHVRDGEKEIVPLNLYDGRGGEYFLWRYCKADKGVAEEEIAEEKPTDENVNEEVTGVEEKITEYFWVRTAEKIELKTWGNVENQTQIEGDINLEININEDLENGESEGNEERATTGSANVFLNGIYGNDVNNGLTYGTAVKTFAKAKELLAEDGTIWICGEVRITSEETWDLGDRGDARIKRWIANSVSGQGNGTYYGNLINLYGNGVLTLSNIVIDGGSGGHIDPKSLPKGNDVTYANGSLVVRSGKGLLIIKDGAILENNYASHLANANWYSEAYGGGAITNDAVGATNNDDIIIMEGGEIRNCLGTLSGAIYHDYYGKVTIKGGKIHNNHGGIGHYAVAGFLRLRLGVLNIEGGEIYENAGNRAGAIHIFDAGLLNVSGGKIHDNWTSDDYVGGDKNDHAAGFLYAGNATTRVYITGGEIYNNSAVSAITRQNKYRGATIGAIGMVDGAELHMSGGKIYGNQAGGESYTKYGIPSTGGILTTNWGSYNQGKVFFSGNVEIDDNYVVSGENGAPQSENEILKERNVYIHKTDVTQAIPFNIEGDLDTQSRIGVTFEEKDVTGAVVGVPSGEHVLTEQDLNVLSNDRFETGESAFDINFDATGKKFVLGDPRDYNVTYDLNGGEGTAPEGKKYAKGTEVTVEGLDNIIPPVGYEFDHWKSNVPVLVEEKEVTILSPKDKFIMPSTSVELTAQWKEAKGDVSFEGITDDEEYIVKLLNRDGKVMEKDLPKVLVNGKPITSEQAEKLTYTYESYVRTRVDGKYVYDWSGEVLQEGDESDSQKIDKLPIRLNRMTEMDTNVGVASVYNRSGIVKVNISYGEGGKAASCILIVPGDVNLNGSIRYDDAEMLLDYLRDVITLNSYPYQRMMADINGENTVPPFRISGEDVELLENMLL